MIDDADLKTAQGAFDEEDFCPLCKEPASQCHCRLELLPEASHD